VDYITNVYNTETTVTLPAGEITITATYKEEDNNNGNNNENVPLFSWNMEAGDVVLDEGSAQQDLTNHNSVTTGGTEPNPPGYGSVGAVLNGTNQYFSLSNSDYGNRALNGTDSDGTIYIAFRPDVISSKSHELFSFYKPISGERQLNIDIVNGQAKILLGYNEGNSIQQVKIYHTFSAGEDIIIALSLDASTKEYTFIAKDVDDNTYYSTTESTTPLQGTYNTGTSDLTIGSRSDLASAGFADGTLYWVRVYDEAHSEEKMKEIMENEIQTQKGETYQESLTKNELKAFPNPSTGIFTFNIEDIALEYVKVTDASGRNIKPEIVSNADKMSINISGNPDGLYFISFKTNDGIFSTKVLLKN
jgi:hypothetical protein